MTRRKREEALIEDARNGVIHHLRELADIIEAAHRREDAIRAITRDLLANDGALDAVGNGSCVTDIFGDSERYAEAAKEYEIGEKLLAILDGDEATT